MNNLSQQIYLFFLFKRLIINNVLNRENILYKRIVKVHHTREYWN